ncbi:ABC transporter substrate-binding protein [Amycolatopsis pigmentata]|uniref:ABC transporter substrate-binding protein n=1 Tax=Amycolatopsis pigmentata TaxID=450801 RepID=A0ABW5FLL6_9PSEU
MLAPAVAMVVGLAACSGGAATGGGSQPQVLRVAHNTPPTSLDPALAATFGSTFLNLVYESLLKRDDKGEVGPGLAKEWKLSADAKQLDLTLRDGVKFQDNAPFNAEAVKANLDAAPKRGGDIPNQLSLIETVVVVDPTHVKITMKRPASDLLGILASEAGMMISPAALGSKDLGKKPVGTGPFLVDVFNQTGITYKKWPGYWDAARVKLDRIEYLTGLDDPARLNALLTGQADLGTSMRTTQIAEADARGDQLKSSRATVAQINAIMLNTSRSKLANPAMRLAIQHAIDRKAIQNALFEGGCQPVAQPFPTTYWASDPALEQSKDAAYDPDTARKLLQDAGLVGTPLKLYVGSTAVFQNMAAAVQQQLNAIGLKVSVEVLDAVALSKARASGDFEASIASVQSGRPDPALFVRQFYLPGGIFNPGNTKYTGIDQALSDMNTTNDMAKRSEDMHQIDKAVLEQGPTVIPICAPDYVNIYKSNVKGVRIPVAMDFDLSTLYFDPPK